MTGSGMKIRELNDMAQLEECAEVQEKVWGISKVDVIPTHLMRAYTDPQDTWGILLGAYVDGKMVGISFTLPTARADTYLLHMIGVLPDYQHQNIGHNLLLVTEDMSRKRGTRKIVLTYDPLESVNANLYLNKHGGICRSYAVDYYRVYGSRTHSGFPADRFKVEIFTDKRDREKVVSPSSVRKTIEIEIPTNFQQLKAQHIQNAIDWRHRTRDLFSRYINEEGYIATTFTGNYGRGTGKYLLEKPITEK